VKRLHFIRLSATALGGLLVTRRSAAADSLLTAPHQTIQLPTGVFVGLDTGPAMLATSGSGIYRYQDVGIRLTEEGSALRILVTSPTKPLHYVRLEWNLSVAGGAVLADEWERTYGDDGFRPAQPGKRMPWYCIHHQEDQTVCFGVRTGCKSLCYWEGGGPVLRLTMDTRSGGVCVVLGDRSLPAADIVILKGTEGESVFATARRFCRLMCDNPRLPRRPVYGINDWYYAYGNNDPALILRQTSLMTELATDPENRPFSVVDAGWAFYSPYHPGDGGWNDDFSRPNDKFKDMGKLASDIGKLGMRPGLWMRPLCASYKDPASLLLPTIPGRDDPKSPVLDPTIEDNLARVKNNIALYRQWGYEMVKHDYSTYDIFGKWGFQMEQDVTTPGWRFRDNTRTTAEIILGLYEAIREAGGDMYLIGCNTLSHLSAGVFELSRVGDDTSGKEWARTRKMGVNTLGFRTIQHDLFYAADGDCVAVTKDVPWDKTVQWMQLVAGAGTPLFISAQPEVVGAEQKAMIRECFSMAARPLPAGEPLDWLTNPQPARWKLDGKIREFDWSDH
jgi:alpha-galactosidase